MLGISLLFKAPRFGLQGTSGSGFSSRFPGYTFSFTWASFSSIHADSVSQSSSLSSHPWMIVPLAEIPTNTQKDAP